MGKATKIRAIARKHDALAEAAAAAGMPLAQNDSNRLALADATIEDGHRRSASQTVRRLTRVEILERAGVLERHEAQACEWYAEIAALAWDTTGCTANYEGGGGGGGAHAPDRLMAKRQDIADARDDYREARAMLGQGMGDAFEAIVCRNEGLGPTAAAAFPDLKRSQAGERLRKTVKFCAGALHVRFGKLMGWAEIARAAAPAASAAPAREVERAPTLWPAVTGAIRLSRLKGQAPDAFWIAASCYAALCQELEANDIDTVEDLPVIVRDDWRWGYVAVTEAGPDIAA